jgi:hypothetical protein
MEQTAPGPHWRWTTHRLRSVSSTIPADLPWVMPNSCTSVGAYQIGHEWLISAVRGRGGSGWLAAPLDLLEVEQLAATARTTVLDLLPMIRSSSSYCGHDLHRVGQDSGSRRSWNSLCGTYCALPQAETRR